MTIGEAYGFFVCEASKDEIKAELPSIMEDEEVPSDLELKLVKIDKVVDDSDLFPHIELAKKHSVNYAIEATKDFTPGYLDMWLIEYALDYLTDDTDILLQIPAQDEIDKALKVVLNREVADLLSAILTNMLLSSFPAKDKKLNAEIVYRDNGKYVYLD